MTDIIQEEEIPTEDMDLYDETIEIIEEQESAIEPDWDKDETDQTTEAT